jgi:uncharacterized protein YjbI with pentapeptide repeats
VGELAAVARPPGTDDVWHAVSAVNVDWTTSDARGWRLIGGRLARVRAAGSRWVGVRWDDVSADACDFANGDWTGGVLQRVDLRDCRFTGANLSECRLTDVRLTGCRLGQTAAHAAIFTRCLFIDCDLRDGDFEGADLRGATFRRCDLRNARLAGARLDGTDLRGSQIAGLWVDVTKIRGVIIDPSQAADLVAVAGVSVRSLTS